MKKIYHYTKEDGMIGMCNKNELWVSKASLSKNDREDSQYIKKILLELSQEYISENNFFIKALEVMQSVLNPVGEEFKEDYLLNNVYMFCVNEIENDDKMKVEYGPKKIIFLKEKCINNFEQLKNKKNLYTEFRYGEVIYDSNKHKHMLITIIKNIEQMYYQLDHDKFENHFSPILASTPTNDISGNTFLLYRNKNTWKSTRELEFEKMARQGKMWTFLTNEFYRVAPFIKNPEYKTEKEFRFAFYRSKTRSSDSPNKLVLPISPEIIDRCIELDILK